MHTTSSHQETALPVTRDGKSRARRTMDMAGHWSSRQPFPWAPTTCMDWDKGSPRSLEKGFGQKFSHKHSFNFLLHNHLEITTLRTVMRQTWSVKDFSLAGGKSLRHESIPKKAWWCSPAGLGSCALSAPLLSHAAGVGCRSVSVSVRTLNFQQWWFKGQFSHSHVGPRDTIMSLGVPKGIPECDRC